MKTKSVLRSRPEIIKIIRKKKKGVAHRVVDRGCRSAPLLFFSSFFLSHLFFPRFASLSSFPRSETIAVGLDRKRRTRQPAVPVGGATYTIEYIPCFPRIYDGEPLMVYDETHPGHSNAT